MATHIIRVANGQKIKISPQGLNPERTVFYLLIVALITIITRDNCMYTYSRYQSWAYGVRMQPKEFNSITKCVFKHIEDFWDTLQKDHRPIQYKEISYKEVI